MGRLLNQLEAILQGKGHSNISKCEIKDLLIWVKVNTQNTDLKSDFTFDFWDQIKWKIHNLVSLKKEESLAKLMPVSRALMERFDQNDCNRDFLKHRNRTPGSETSILCGAGPSSSSGENLDFVQGVLACPGFLQAVWTAPRSPEKGNQISFQLWSCTLFFPGFPESLTLQPGIVPTPPGNHPPPEFPEKCLGFFLHSKSLGAHGTCSREAGNQTGPGD